jgi:hypothetical protein
MKKLMLIAVLGLCSTLSAIQDKVIILPSAEILEQRLQAIGLHHFLEKTKLHRVLGNQEKYPLGVAVETELALYDYNEYMQDQIIAVQMQMHKPLILEALLQDHPEAIENLKLYGILK